VHEKTGSRLTRKNIIIKQILKEEKITHHTHAYTYTHTHTTHKHTYTNNKRREETRGTMAAAEATDNCNARRSTRDCCGSEAAADDGGRAAA